MVRVKAGVTALEGTEPEVVTRRNQWSLIVRATSRGGDVHEREHVVNVRTRTEARHCRFFERQDVALQSLLETHHSVIVLEEIAQ